MKMLKLEREKHNEPNLANFTDASDLKDFLNEDANMNYGKWKENPNAILDFQDDDGSFRLFDSCEIPSDAKVDFHAWTYICIVILMKASMTDSFVFTPKGESRLLKLMHVMYHKISGGNFEMK